MTYIIEIKVYPVGIRIVLLRTKLICCSLCFHVHRIALLDNAII